MRIYLAVCAATLLLAVNAQAATLTITPDKPTYMVGETIALSVFGDSEGDGTEVIFGQILFDPLLAEFSSATQEPLTSFGIPWTTGALFQGSGFATAFNQVRPDGLFFPDGPLVARVTLVATSTGTLGLEWGSSDGFASFRFFDLTDVPGETVLIVPEPATALLLALGLVALHWNVTQAPPNREPRSRLRPWRPNGPPGTIAAWPSRGRGDG